MDIVRWGLLSTANINRKLIPAIRESTRGNLVAVASRSLKNAQAYAAKWKIPKVFGSYIEMLQSRDIDAVYIGLPNHLHAEWTIKSLKSGTHVLCEKPFATSLVDVDMMISASQESGCALAEAFMYRHHPQTKVVADLVKSEKLGEITLIRGTFDYRLPEKQRQPGNTNVRLVPDYGGGSLWDVGVYPISFAQYLMGRPPDQVFGNQHLGETGIDEVFAGQMVYENKSGKNTQAQISCSFNTPYHTFMEIIGTEGRVYLTRPFNNLKKGAQVIVTNKKGNTRRIRVQKKPLYLGEVEDLQGAILDNTNTLISLDETRNHILTVLALYESARTGRVVELNSME